MKLESLVGKRAVEKAFDVLCKGITKGNASLDITIDRQHEGNIEVEYHAYVGWPLNKIYTSNEPMDAVKGLLNLVRKEE